MTGAYLPACDDCIASNAGKSWIRAWGINTTLALATLRNFGVKMLMPFRQKHWFFIDAFIRCDGNLAFILILGMVQASAMPRPLSPFQPGSTQP